MNTRAAAFETNGSGLRSSEGPVPLLGVAAVAEVLAGHARVVLRQRFKNEEARPIEAIYTFPLPSRAAITAFSMTVLGRRLEGEVLEREAAFQQYDEAVTAGHGAALLEQERPNVFVANVGNLLAGEETTIEVEYVEPLLADEGAMRFCLPTLVAPRYVPGVPSGDRQGHGVIAPTDRVPDADRISPPTGTVEYGLSLDLVFDVGVEVDVECASHAVDVRREGTRSHVTFTQREVPLDRDIVVRAYAARQVSASAPLASVVAHRAPGSTGFFAVTVVSDLEGALAPRSARSDVVFVLDRSGSMGGASMAEAKTALKLCLRQLREGDRFSIIAFDDAVESFDPRLVTFTEATLRRADLWIDGVEARGGTELHAPLLRAVELVPAGVVVLLTDGQVANEDEILRDVVARRGKARVHSFGIGTNVSDALLLALADKSGGAVESIYPGERVDEKVIAQFARAMAPRITDVQLSFRGVTVGELAPAEPRDVIDGEPYTVFGTYEAAGVGALEIRGVLEGQRYYLEVPVELSDDARHPAVEKLWAKARITDLERAALTGRRADAMKDRIVKLAKAHGLSSRHTSFVVVEKRVGDRRVSVQADTRVVPVAAPAGWAMMRAQRARSYAVMCAAPASPAPMPMMRTSAGAPPPPRAMAARHAPPPALPAPPVMAAPMPAMFARSSAPRAEVSAEEEGSGSPDPVVALLTRQGASGLWEEPGEPTLRVTARALHVLLLAGVGGDHAVFGAQVKKAALAVLDAVRAAPPDAPLLGLLLGEAWLLLASRRARRSVEELARARAVTELVGLFGGASEASVRGFVDRLSRDVG